MTIPVHVTTAAARCSGGVGAGGNLRLYRERYYDTVITAEQEPPGTDNRSDAHSMLGILVD